MSQNQGGDSLARGAVKFQFQPAGANVTQEKWDSIWEEEPKKDVEKPKTSGTVMPTLKRKVKVGAIKA
jgi:hypothetical protein